MSWSLVERRTRRRAAHHLMAVAVVALAVSCAPGGGPVASAPRVDAPVAPAGLEVDDVEAWLDGFVPAAIEQREIAGAAVAVVADGQIVTTRGYGWAQVGTSDTEPLAVDPDRTLFRVGSVSKLLTATAAMQLVESGRLDLDADIDRYLDLEVPRSFDEDVTLRHLLTHTAGFEERLTDLIGDAPVDLRDHLATDPPDQVYAPGTIPAYSNYGSALVGYIVERVSGMPFDGYVERHVLDPAAMGSASFRQPLPEDAADRLSEGYVTSAGTSQPFEFVGPAPAGSLSASATDMAGFMLAHLGGEPGGEPLLDDTTRELMHAPGSDADALGDLARARRMTLGFFDESRNGRRVLGHGGDTRHFHSHLQIFPDDGAGIFVSFNSTGAHATDTVELREHLLAGFADRYLPAVDTEPASVTTDPQTLERATATAGTYVSARGFDSTFLALLGSFDTTRATVVDDGQLLFEPGPGTFAPAIYEEHAPGVWRDVGGHRELSVRVDDGQVTAIGHDSALTLLPARAGQRLAVPVLVAAAATLATTVVAWPLAAVRHRLRRRRSAGRRRGRSWTLTRVAAVSSVLALVGWGTSVASILGFQQVTTGTLRAVQVLQAVGIAGIVPATISLGHAMRRRAGWRRIAADALVLAALAGLAWVAFAFNLVASDVAY